MHLPRKSRSPEQVLSTSNPQIWSISEQWQVWIQNLQGGCDFVSRLFSSSLQGAEFGSPKFSPKIQENLQWLIPPSGQQKSQKSVQYSHLHIVRERELWCGYLHTATVNKQPHDLFVVLPQIWQLSQSGHLVEDDPICPEQHKTTHITITDHVLSTGRAMAFHAIEH